MAKFINYKHTLININNIDCISDLTDNGENSFFIVYFKSGRKLQFTFSSFELAISNLDDLANSLRGKDDK